MHLTNYERSKLSHTRSFAMLLLSCCAALVLTLGPIGRAGEKTTSQDTKPADKTDPVKGQEKKDEPKKDESKKDTPKFTAIVIQGQGKVVLHQGKVEAVGFKGDPALQEQIHNEVRDGTLYVGGPDGAEIHIGVIELKRLQIEGSGSFEARDLKGKQLAVSISGSGSMKLAGTVDEHEVTINGSGDVFSEGLRAKKATVKISGSGTAFVQATDNLNVNIQGSGTVEYVGQPKVEQTVGGEATIRPHQPKESKPPETKPK
jgi:hypothetical protein